MSRRDLLGEAQRLVERYLRRPLPRRFAHVAGVASRARLFASLLSKDDAEVLEASALLHDLGYSPELVVTGFHPLDGAAFLVAQEFPYRLCSLVAHHSCAYREAELRGLSAAIAQWEDEQTVLRDALWWADMTTSPDGVAMNVHDRIEEVQKRYGPEDLVTFFIRQAKPELVAAVERTEGRLREAGIDYTVK